MEYNINLQKYIYILYQKMAPWLLLHDLSSHNVAFNAKAVV